MSEKTFLSKLGQNIANERIKRGISQDKLYLEAEIGRRTINRIETGAQNPTALLLLKIAEALNVEVSVFFKGL